MPTKRSELFRKMADYADYVEVDLGTGEQAAALALLKEHRSHAGKGSFKRGRKPRNENPQ